MAATPFPLPQAVHAKGSERLCITLLALGAFAVGVWAGRPYAIGVFHDDGVYAVLAKALATGQGYRYLHLPGAPAATHYPPGYPFFLSLVWRIWPTFPDNIRLLLAANAVLLGAVAVGVERFCRRVLDWPMMASVIVALVATISYPLILLSSLLLSETLFVALLLPSLIVAERMLREDQRWQTAAMSGVCAGLLILVRTHGAAFLLAMLACLALRRRFKSAVIVTAVAIVIVAPWQLWSMAHVGEISGPLTGSYGSYVGWWAEGARAGGASLFAHTVSLNVREVVALLADRFSLSDAATPRLATAALAVVLAAVGAYHLARKAPTTVAFILIYLAVLLVWPFTPWRFFYAVWPIVVVLIGETVLASRVTTTGRSIAIGSGVLIVAGMVREEARAYRERSWRQGAQGATAQISPVVNWIRTHTSPGDVVAAEGEPLLYLFAGRQVVPLTAFTASEYMAPRSREQNSAMIVELIDHFRIRYLVPASPAFVAASDALTSDTVPHGWHLVMLDRLPNGGAAYRVDGR